MLGDHGVEPPVQVGIQLIVARSELDAVALDPISHLEDRLARPDVKRLRFLAPRDRAPVVVGQDDDRHTAQAGIEQP